MLKSLSFAVLILLASYAYAQPKLPTLTTGPIHARGLIVADSGIVVSTGFNFSRTGYFHILGDTVEFNSANDSLRIWTVHPSLYQVLTANADGIYYPELVTNIPGVGGGFLDTVTINSLQPLLTFPAYSFGPGGSLEQISTQKTQWNNHVFLGQNTSPLGNWDTVHISLSDLPSHLFQYRVADGSYAGRDSVTLKGLTNITVTRSNDTVTVTGVDSVTNSYKADFSTEEHSLVWPIADSLNTTSTATTIAVFSPVWNCTIDSIVAYHGGGTGNIAADRVTGGVTWAPLFASTALSATRTSITITGNNTFTSTNELRIRLLSPSALWGSVYVYWHRTS